jgi:DNA recombination protein RmuC
MELYLLLIEPYLPLIIAFFTLLIGLIIGYLVGKSRSSSLVRDLTTLQERLAYRDEQLVENKNQVEKLRALEDSQEELLAKHREEISTLKERVRNEEQKMLEFQSLQERFSETFKALSSDALKSNNQSFLELAGQSLQKFQEGARGDLEKRQLAIDSLIKPIHENLLRVDTSITELEKNRISAFASLDQHLKSLSLTQVSLMDQTSNLVKALRTPNVRGRWGEIQLQRVVEIAGMVEHCDFYQQETLDDEGKRYRPDMIIRLPGGKTVVVDSKAPLQGYLDALEAKDDTVRLAAFANHARQIRTHINQLAQKKYWEQLKETPEFVVLFLPGENFFSAALEHDPQLIEHGVEQKVIVATPTTLIALLRAISYGWRQEQLEKNAKEISELGKELYERLAIFAGHFADIKKGLEKSVEGYNRAVASLESRVLISARRFRDLGAGGTQTIPEIEGIDSAPRALDMMRVNGE